METSKAVCVSGYLMSSLLYEHNSSDSDQEGFLIGDIIVRQTETINDNQLSLKKEETVVNIYSYVPCEDVYSFYTCAGNIEMEKLEFYLKNKQKDVVGWYRFRRHTPLVMSLREKTVHRNLNLALSREKKMVFGLFSSCVSSNLATHTFDHTFFIYSLPASGGTGTFDSIALNIVNLEDSAHDEYRLHPRAPVNTKSGIYKDIVTPSQLEEQLPESVLLSEDVNTALLDKIEGLMEQVGGSEAEIGCITLDIKELQEKIARSIAKGVQLPGSHQRSHLEASTSFASSQEIEKETNEPSKASDHDNIIASQNTAAAKYHGADSICKYEATLGSSARTRSFTSLKCNSVRRKGSKSASC